jgi:hypothetical protein
MSLKKYKSQGKAVEVTVKSKEETLKTFVWISSKNSASGQSAIFLPSTLFTLDTHFGWQKELNNSSYSRLNLFSSNASYLWDTSETKYVILNENYADFKIIAFHSDIFNF